MADETNDNAIDSIALAAELTVAWLGNPNVRVTADEIPAFLRTIHETIGALANGGGAIDGEAVSEYTPAVSVRSSVKPDYIVSLITGQKLKSLKRHLASHGLTPAEYRERYGLKPDYPMVAPNYSAHRREIAQKLRLGRKGRAARTVATESAPAAASAAVPAKPADKPGRKASAKPKADAKAAPVRRTRAKKAETPAA
jgi:predicted transcriptional regulator